MDRQTRERLTDAILSALGSTYQLPTGERIQGQSISYLSQELRDRRWRGVSNLNDLESTCEELGFKIVRAQMVRFGTKLCAPARVVTL